VSIFKEMWEKAVKIEVRTCDNQCAFPMVFGVTKKDRRYPFLTATAIRAIGAEDYMPSFEEVLKSRGK